MVVSRWSLGGFLVVFRWFLAGLSWEFQRNCRGKGLPGAGTGSTRPPMCNGATIAYPTATWFTSDEGCVILMIHGFMHCLFFFFEK